MGQISVLDCTLRDGGYVNDFRFGNKAIKSIINGLANASIDIIECGFLRSGEFDENSSVFPTIESLRDVIGAKKKQCMYVAMIQYGAIPIGEISDCDGRTIDGIRLTFHEHEIEPSFALGRQLMEKGYKVFMQPVGTTTYEDDTLIQLVKKINELKPFAFYIVDTLGKMYKKDLLRLFYIIDHNLDPQVSLGLHSHNNLQMSFAHAQELSQINTTRKIIIDASILGMGRGAGNLNTELLVQYLNINKGLKYDLVEIMALMDEYIRPLNNIYKWGYEAAYYIAAVNDCHPNYAAFLLNLQTLCIRDINVILNRLSPQRKKLFDKEYINEEYIKYMDRLVDDKDALEAIRQMISGRKVLLLAPGKSLRSCTREIHEYQALEDPFVISVNFFPTDIEVDTVFVSNMKRFKSLEDLVNTHAMRIILTSNIEHGHCPEDVLIVNYSSYLNEEDCIVDNAGLMCINMLKKIGVRQIRLAGFDGFSANIDDNFYEESLYLDVEESRLVKMNSAMSLKFKQLKNQLDLSFLYGSSYEGK